jgi:hypothetical protein
MAKETLEAVARAIAGARWEDAYAAVWKSKESFVDDMWMHYRNQAQSATDAMPGWDWACDSMADAFLYKPGKRPDHDHMDVMGCAKNSPATAFAIAMLRAVGEKE